MLCEKCEVRQVALETLSGNIVAACLRGKTGCLLESQVFRRHAQALRRLADALERAAEMREREEGEQRALR